MILQSSYGRMFCTIHCTVKYIKIKYSKFFWSCLSYLLWKLNVTYIVTVTVYSIQYWIEIRVGNSLFEFPCELLVFLEWKSKSANRSGHSFCNGFIIVTFETQLKQTGIKKNDIMYNSRKYKVLSIFVYFRYFFCNRPQQFCETNFACLYGVQIEFFYI